MESRNYGQNGAGPSSSAWNSSQQQQTEAARLVEQSYESGLLEGHPLVVKKRFSKLRPVGGELVREHGHHCLLYEFNQNRDMHEAHGNIERVYGTNAPRMTQCQTVYEEFEKRLGIAKEANEECSAPSPAAPKRKRPSVDYSRMAKLKKEKKLRKMEKIRAAQLAKKKKRAEMKAMGKAGDEEEAGQKVEEEKQEEEEQPENENLRNVRIQTESTFSNLGHWLRPPKEPKKQEEDEAVTVTKTKNYNYLIMVRKALAERGEGANLYEIIGHVLMHGPMPDGTSKKVILDSTLNALSRLQMESTRLAVEEKEVSKAERPSTSTSNNSRPNVVPSTPNTGNELVDFILNQANLEISLKEEEGEGEEMQGT